MENFVENQLPLYVLSVAIVMTIIRWLFVEKIFSRIALFFRPEIERRARIKFSESSFFCYYYLFVWVWGFSIIIYEDYFLDSRYFWIGYPQKVTTEFKTFYLFQLGYYISAFVYELNLVGNLRTKHKDRAVMIAHHTVTILLVLFSYLVGYQRIGIMVYVLHDISDILLEFSKSFHYLTGDKHIRIKNFSFFSFAVIFFVTRIILYPLICIRSAIWETYEILKPEDSTYVIYFIVLLLCLEAMHLFWFFLICGMIYKALKGDLKSDVRSDDEEDEKEEITQKKSY